MPYIPYAKVVRPLVKWKRKAIISTIQRNEDRNQSHPSCGNRWKPVKQMKTVQRLKEITLWMLTMTMKLKDAPWKKSAVIRQHIKAETILYMMRNPCNCIISVVMYELWSWTCMRLNWKCAEAMMKTQLESLNRLRIKPVNPDEISPEYSLKAMLS